jgi:hypothetical protein
MSNDLKYNIILKNKKKNISPAKFSSYTFGKADAQKSD